MCRYNQDVRQYVLYEMYLNDYLVDCIAFSRIEAFIADIQLYRGHYSCSIDPIPQNTHTTILYVGHKTYL